MFKGNQNLDRLLVGLIVVSLMFACDEDTRHSAVDNLNVTENIEDVEPNATTEEIPSEAKLARTVIDESMDITTVVFGHARDRQDSSLEGVKVTLYGDKLYETTTDANGYFRFPEVFIGSARALIGMAATGDVQANQEPLTIGQNYTLTFSHEGLGTSVREVQVQATGYRTANSFVYETAPVGHTALLLPYANATIRVVTGETTADGSPIAAGGADVEIRTVPDSEASQFQTTTVRTQADADGRVVITAEHKLPAAAGYRLVVFPYDADPAAGNGFEYDTVLQDIDLAPYSYFAEDANAAYQAGEIFVNLRDNETTNAAPRIAFTDPPANGTLAPAETIRIVFSRPIKVETIRYRILGCADAACEGDPNTDVGKTPVLTTQLALTPLELAIQVTDAHPYIFAGFHVIATAETFDGQTLRGDIRYGIDDSVRPLDVAVPRPELNLAAVDDSVSEAYYSAVDAASIFVADRDEFDPESYIGNLVNSLDNALTPSMNPEGADGDSLLEIRFDAVPGAVGYRVFLKDSHRAVNWMEVDNINASFHQTAADAKVVTTVNLENYFGLFDGDFPSPFCCGNVVQLAVLPYFAQSDGASGIDATRMAGVDPNAVLSLTDNFGPSIHPAGSGIFGTPTEFGGLLYNEMATIAFSERMSGVDAPSETSFEVTGRFAIGFSQWVVDDNYTTWRVQLDPTFVTPDKLYIGDSLRTIDQTDDNPTCEVTKIDLCGATPLVTCGGEVYSDASYEILGPVSDEQPFETEGVPNYRLRDNIQPGNEFFASDFLDADGEPNRFFLTGTNDIRWAIKVGNETFPVRPQLGSPTANERRVSLREAFRTTVDLSAQPVTLSNNVNLELTAAIAVAVEGTPELVTLPLNSIEGLAVNQVITILDQDSQRVERVQIQSLDANLTTVKVNASFNHAAGTVVALHYAGVTQLPSVLGGGDTPQAVVLANQNGVLNTWFDPAGDCANGCYQVRITAPDNDTQIALVKSVTGNTLVLSGDLTDQDPRGLEKEVPEGSKIELVERSVTLNQVILGLNNLRGVRANSTLNLTVGQGDNNPAASNTASYTACAVDLNGEAFLTSNGALASVTVQDSVLPFADGDLRPMDKIKVLTASDAAGNSIRAAADELLATGEVE